ncbi:tetratricopeptide repeat protein [Marinobacter sp.]|uniref:tetratricopeptide repeat protein n=1 Tax=Marinobacter sp. TaxID=50741 RepID=UPI0034A5629E
MIKPLRRLFAIWLLALASGNLLANPSGCVECHAGEVAEWSGSQHAVAMSEATAESVAGDFSGARYEDSDLRVQFQQEGSQFQIHTHEGDKKREWTVRYTFGVYPLQQYLIDIGEGRLQAFNIAWDTRDKADGGQRWFRLDEPGGNRPGDAMHWTGIYQNWNNQCADCHSTGLARNYDPVEDQYHTDFKHVAVSCTACHDSAGEHAEARRNGQSLTAGVELAAVGAWLVSEGKQPPRRQGPESNSAQVSTCGKCHSLRTSLTDSNHGQMHDQFSLSRLDQPLYFSDGRVREEVFVLGSFEQSRLFQAGVVCTDCHNPHTGKLKIEGNGVCAQCHNAGDYDTPDHHHHPLNSEGAQCVNCHMPEATFMKIDDRREHSFMVPRPDVSRESGSPDVCLACHTDEDRAWSIATVENWYPDLYESDTWHHVQQQNLPEILAYLENEREPAIRRATLLEQHGEVLAARQTNLLARLSQDSNALIRESAMRVLRHGDMDRVRSLAENGLADDSLAVRLAAFESMVWSGTMPDPERWAKVQQEYEHYVDTQSDLPAGSVLKARYLLAGDYVYKAEQQLKRALSKDPGYVPATIVLTDILRSGDRNLEAVRAIDQTLGHSPDEPQLIHLRGLIRIRLQDYPAALADLEQAHTLAPGQWLFGYRYAVALFQLDQKEKARQVTQTMLQRYPDNAQLRALMNHL